MEEQMNEEGQQEQQMEQSGEGAGDSGAPELGVFYSGLSDEYQKDPTFEKFKNADFDTIAKTLVNQEKLVGREKIARPKADDPDDVARFYRELGVPESADKYELDAPSEWASEIGYKQDVFKNIAHEAHLTPEQAKLVEQGYLKDAQATMQRYEAQQKEARGKAEQALRSELGEDFEPKMTTAEMVADQFAKSPEVAGRIKSMIKTDPEFAATMIEIAGQFAEHRIGTFEAKASNLTRSSAQAKINEIRNNLNHPYWNNVDPDAHNAAVEEMFKLEQIAEFGR